ncbi:MAG: hypothetical protein H7263_18000 [Candidatus Sericytochromatia bacterium]|nr:hypothetical protein [Candidatus Sericytochromatia bacterium]
MVNQVSISTTSVKENVPTNVKTTDGTVKVTFDMKTTGLEQNVSSSKITQITPTVLKSANMNPNENTFPTKYSIDNKTIDSLIKLPAGSLDLMDIERTIKKLREEINSAIENKDQDKIDALTSILNKVTQGAGEGKGFAQISKIAIETVIELEKNPSNNKSTNVFLESIKRNMQEDMMSQITDKRIVSISDYPERTLTGICNRNISSLLNNISVSGNTSLSNDDVSNLRKILTNTVLSTSGLSIEDSKTIKNILSKLAPNYTKELSQINNMLDKISALKDKSSALAQELQARASEFKSTSIALKEALKDPKIPAAVKDAMSDIMYNMNLALSEGNLEEAARYSQLIKDIRSKPEQISILMSNFKSNESTLTNESNPSVNGIASPVPNIAQRKDILTIDRKHQLEAIPPAQLKAAFEIPALKKALDGFTQATDKLIDVKQRIIIFNDTSNKLLSDIMETNKESSINRTSSSDNLTIRKSIDLADKLQRELKLSIDPNKANIVTLLQKFRDIISELDLKTTSLNRKNDGRLNIDKDDLKNRKDVKDRIAKLDAINIELKNIIKQSQENKALFVSEGAKRAILEKDLKTLSTMLSQF